MPEVKYCPLKSVFAHKEECMGDACAWMMHGGCAIVIIAKEMRRPK